MPFAKCSTNATAPNSSSPARYFEPLHLQQNFPDWLLSSSTSAISSVPINAVLFLPLRHLRYSQSFPPTYQRRHKRNRSPTCDIFRNQTRTSLVNLAAAIFHFVPPFPASPHFLLLFLSSSQRDFGVEAIASYSCFCLVQS